MTTSTPYSMTWPEVLVLVAIASILIALLMAPGQSGGSGTFELQLTLDEDAAERKPIRFAKVYQKRLASRKVDLADLIWWTADEVKFPFTMTVMYDTYSRFNAFSELSWVVCTDGLLVEYTAKDSTRYRLIPFEQQRGQMLVEVIIPGKPPSVAEEWKPEVAEGQFNADPQ